MNKSISVLGAVLLLGACAGQPVPVESSNAMINFADIANEISINYEPLDGSQGRPARTAENKTPENSDSERDAPDVLSLAPTI